MRPGPHEKLLTGGVAIGVRVAVMRGNQVLATDVPAVSLQLDASASRSVPEKLTYTAPLEWLPRYPLDPLNSYGQRSQVTVIQTIDGVPYETPLGWFTHGSAGSIGWKETKSGIQVTAFGLLQIPDDDPMPWTSSPPANQRFSREMSRLCGLPVIMDGILDPIISRESQWGNSRLEAIEDLAAIYGYDYRVEPDGYLHIFKRADPYTQAAAAFYQNVIIDAPREGIKRRPNHVVVTGEGGTTERKKRYSATASLNTFPYDEPYGQITEHVKLSSEVTQGEVTRVASDRQRMALFSSQSRSISMIPDPRIELGDLISCQTQDGELITGVVSGYSWSQDQDMRIDLEVATYG